MAGKRDVIDDFAHWYQFEKGLAQSTVDRYASGLRRVVKEKGPLEELTAEDLRDFAWQHRTDGTDTWNLYYYSLRAFYDWWCAKEDAPDPSQGLKPRKQQRTARLIAPDLFERIAGMPTTQRQFAQFVYLTGLELFQVRHLLKSRSRGPDFSVPKRGGKSFFEMHLEDYELQLLFQLRQDAPGSNRTLQKWNQRVGEVTLQEVRAASQADEGAPALRLLVRFPGLAGVAAGLRSALAQVDTNPAKSIQDAATALEDLLTELQARGNRLGPKLKDARRLGLFGHDEKLARAILLMGEWVNADRVESGSGHNIRRGVSDDAWLALRVVEALVVRIVKGFPT